MTNTIFFGHMVHDVTLIRLREKEHIEWNQYVFVFSFILKKKKKKRKENLLLREIQTDEY